MTTLHVYIGFDAMDAIAYRVAEKSILDHASGDVRIHPLRDWDLRRRGLYSRSYTVSPSGQKYDANSGDPITTEFSLTRFLVPWIHAREMRRPGPALFLDPDILVQADIRDLFRWATVDKEVMVVKHRQTVDDATKLGGRVQTQYDRKNWSSVMLFCNPSRDADLLSPGLVGRADAGWLRNMNWGDAQLIGALHPKWNYLVGVEDQPALHADPCIAHFTLGTPDIVPEHYPRAVDQELHSKWWDTATRAGVLQAHLEL